jgi:precorrin-6B methylase 2
MTSALAAPLPTHAPLARAGAAQLAAVALAAAVALVVPAVGVGVLLLVQGAAAAGLARMLKLPLWWQAIEAAFLPAAWALLAQSIPPVWFLAGFLLLASLSVGAARERVPLYLSNRAAHAALLAQLPARPGLRFLDAGCGIGGVVAAVAAARPDAHAEGIESAPLSWLISRVRLGARRNATVRFGSLWHQDLTAYDVVYAYLSPAPMTRLWRKARAEMRPGSLLVSNAFVVPDVAPHAIIAFGSHKRARLHLWRM